LLTELDAVWHLHCHLHRQLILSLLEDSLVMQFQGDDLISRVPV